jgi:hypothetical protein
VVPLEWTETSCGQPIKSPTGNTPFRVRGGFLHISPSLLNGCPVPPPYHLYQANKLKAVVAHPSPPLCSARYGGGHLGPWINFLILLCSLPSPCGLADTVATILVPGSTSSSSCVHSPPCGLTDTVATILVAGRSTSSRVEMKMPFAIISCSLTKFRENRQTLIFFAEIFAEINQFLGTTAVSSCCLLHLPQSYADFRKNFRKNKYFRKFFTKTNIVANFGQNLMSSNYFHKQWSFFSLVSDKFFSFQP